MCVAASQKPMQSASDLPPPPGLLGAASLGLPLPAELPGERASEELPEEPPPVANWLGKGGDIGESGGTVDPGCAVVGAVGPGDAGGVMVGKVGAESRELGAAADERACANAVPGSSNKRAMAARTGGLSVSIEITMAFPAVWLTIGRHIAGVHNLAIMVNVPRQT